MPTFKPHLEAHLKPKTTKDAQTAKPEPEPPLDNKFDNSTNATASTLSSGSQKMPPPA